MIAVEGRIQTRSYDNNEGKRVYVTEVVADDVRFLEAKKDGNYTGEFSQRQNDERSYEKDDPFSGAEGPIDISDDDLPF
jgi:single-strand DNA-binding protein